MTDRTLTLINDDGTEIVCDILFTYYWEETKKDYVVFMERKTQTVSAATYAPTDNGQGTLGKIETEEEWSMLEELLNDYSTRLDDEESGCSGSCQGCSGCSGDCEGCDDCGESN